MRAPKTEDALGPEWLETPEARQAMRVSGWPDCTVGEFLSALSLVIESIAGSAEFLHAALAARGLPYDEFCRMVAESKATVTWGPDAGRFALRSKAERYAVRRLFLAGIGSDHIAALLELPECDVDDYIRAQGYIEQGAEVVRLHIAGRTPVEIVRELGVTRKNVYKLIAAVGQEPHRTQRRLSAETRALIVSAYRDGASYAEIMASLEVDKSQVTNTLRLAHKAGVLPEYGSRAVAS